MKVTAVIAFCTMCVGIITIDSNSILPVAMMCISIGYLMCYLISRWDAIIRKEKERYEDIDCILWREEKNRW